MANLTQVIADLTRLHEKYGDMPVSCCDMLHEKACPMTQDGEGELIKSQVVEVLHPNSSRAAPPYQGTDKYVRLVYVEGDYL